MLFRLLLAGPNTKGGLAANAKREVLDWDLKPIPGLYAVGEIASALKFVYQGGGQPHGDVGLRPGLRQDRCNTAKSCINENRTD